MSGIQAMVNQLQAAQHLRLPEKHQRILEMHDRGTTQREIAHRVAASLSTVNEVINRYRGRGEKARAALAQHQGEKHDTNTGI